MRIKDAYKRACEILSESGAEDAKSDARFLLSYFLDTAPAMLLVKGDEQCSPSEFFEGVRRRAAGEPCAYITGRCEFMSLEFFVDNNVLVPRQDTEALCEAAIDFCKSGKKRVLDICTGSGCIAVSVAAYCKNASVHGVDISESALLVARKNAKHNKAAVSFSRLDILNETPSGEYDLILSNPPYIRSGDIAGLDKTVKDFEPRLALDGGEDGLVFYRAIAEASKNILSCGGALMLEIGFDQGDEVMKILESAGYENIALYYDAAGNPRVVCAVFGKAAQPAQKGAVKNF